MTAARHDCGKHGKLTIAEIAAAAGIGKKAAADRVKRLRHGDDLCKRTDWKASRRARDGDYRLNVNTNAHCSIFIACSIARRFKDRTPSIEWLRNEFGMSMATAYRWRRAWEDAYGRQ